MQSSPTRTSVAEDARLTLGKKRKIIPILNVVDLSEFSPEGNALDLDALSGMTSAASGTVRVGLLATMAWWKGHRLFLDALAKLPAGTAGTRLHHRWRAVPDRVASRDG